MPALAVACHKAPPAPVEPGPPTGPMVAASSAAGSYRLRATLQRRSATAHGAPAETPMTLTYTPSAAPAVGAPATSYNATISLPGYTHPPRGRNTQGASWWPIAGDSVVVQFTYQRADLVQLRGRLSGGSLRGEVWYYGGESGTSYQLGTFTAQKR
jgi:hypothetical protein